MAGQADIISSNAIVYSSDKKIMGKSYLPSEVNSDINDCLIKCLYVVHLSALDGIT